MESKPKQLIDEYILEKQIGSGSFGEVYEVEDKKTKQKLALKIEKKTDASLLKEEYRIYSKLEKTKTVMGIPKIHKFTITEDYNMLAMELLDKSLETLFDTRKIFKTETVMLLGIDIVNLLESIHKNDYIHRDIKPNNFMIGHSNPEKLYIMDFGLAKRYRYGDKHIPYKSEKSLTGTARYASINIHHGVEPSRRDDLISVGYMLLYFAKGRLPWQGLKKDKKRDHLKNIGDIKLSTSLEILCKNIPDCLSFCLKKYLTYCNSLKFEQEPNYNYLKTLFIDAAAKAQLQLKYEWV